MKNSIRATAIIVLAIVMILAMSACGGSPSGTETDADKAAALQEIITDKEARTVTISATVNGDMLGKSTMHFVVNKDGKVAAKSMLIAYCTPEDFYNAMVEVGGKPWTTDSSKIKAGEYTDGDKVDVTMTWDGQEEPVGMADVIKTDDGAFNVDMRFSGNMDNNIECGSGCISCLNSCWAGITSNKAYAYDDIDSGKVTAYANADALPESGTVVKITYTFR